jgi:3' exoribonuclease, RNase T-like
MKTYFSVDIETDGVVAGRNNMLSIGVAAIDMDTGKIVDTFKRNLERMPDLTSDEDTMNWWKKQNPKAYIGARMGAKPPTVVMMELIIWVQKLWKEDSVVFAWNPVMDLAFVRYYLHRFHPNGVNIVLQGFGKRSFGLDQKTAAAIALKVPYRSSNMSSVPPSLRLDDKGELLKEHSHDALEDAIEQAYIFYNSVRRLGMDL